MTVPITMELPEEVFSILRTSPVQFVEELQAGAPDDPARLWA